MGFLHSAAYFIVAIGVLVTVHEFGHFIVAKRLGVKVLRFSVGFGRPLVSRRAGPDQTEYVVAAIPLGGYVKMLDEREGEVPAAELPRAFNRQSLKVRMAIVVAGPLFNFIFAVFAYWLMFVIGIGGLKPIVDEVTPGSAAARAGLVHGDEIVRVAGRDTLTWEGVMQGVIGAALNDEPVSIQVQQEGERPRKATLDLAGLELEEIASSGFFEKLGMEPMRLKVPPVIAWVEAGGAAQAAGLLPGDRILAADGKPIDDWREWVEYVRGHGGKSVQVRVDREGAFITLLITPALVAGDEGTIGFIGAKVVEREARADRLYAVERYSPVVALAKAVGKTGEISKLTLNMLWKMLLLEVSLQNLSGPISIAQYAGHSARVGVSRFLEFLAIVSISLGILNLLPIPLLDGGHLMYYLIELFKGGPISDEAQLMGQRVGIALLVGLMGLAVFNDLARLLG